MSNKPPKKSDENKWNAKTKRRERLTEVIEQLPPYTMIFCEGTKTEPQYLQGFIDSITERYKRYAIDNRIQLADIIQIKGVSLSGKYLFEHARKNVSAGIAQVWLVYDKDDFPLEDFNATPEMAAAESKRGSIKYATAWSNECIELWFLLHFQDLESNVSRDNYTEKLKKYYPEYTKNATDVYARLQSQTDTAIKRAEKLHKSYDKSLTPSEMAPCTTVYKLVEFLRKYT